MIKYLLPLLLIFSFIPNSNEEYYWYFNEKISLNIDKSRSLIIYENEKSLQEIEKYANQNTSTISLEKTPYKAIKVHFKSSTNDKKWLEDIALKYSDIFITDSFEYEGEHNYMLNEIIVKPKGSINEVIKVFGNKIKIIKNSEYNTFLLGVYPKNNVLSLSNDIYESGLVEWSQPNFLGAKHFNNTLYPDQYYLNNTGQFGGTTGIDINAPEAWSITEGCGIRVAVIDQGIDPHEEFGTRLVTGFDPLNLSNPGHALTNDDSHGLPCAGIIAAANNTIGIRGVASNSIIVPIKITLGHSFYSDYDIALAINWAWDNGAADILSNSWGGGPSSPAITNAITNAQISGRSGLGSIVVFASGNFRPTQNTIPYPANLSNVVTVGAIDKNGNIWDYSRRGPEMDLVAPSGDINNLGDVRTTDRMGIAGYTPNNYINVFGGTSAAAPQVAGVAALMLSVNPNLTEPQVRTFLQQTATDMGTSGFDNTFGFGRLNAEAAVKRALGTSIVGPDLICTTGTFSVSQSIPGLVWSTNRPGVSINSSGVLNANGYSGGPVTIYAKASGSCGTLGISKTVWIGTPYVDINVPDIFCINQVQSISATNTMGDPYITGYNWTHSPNLYISGVGNTVTASTSNLGIHYVYLTTTNACGTSAIQSLGIYAEHCSPKFEYKIYPNPAKTHVYIEFPESIRTSDLPDKLILFSDFSLNQIKSIPFKDLTENKIKIDVADLPKGIYYLHLTGGEQNYSEKFRLQID
jgi:hypothetical protein